MSTMLLDWSLPRDLTKKRRLNVEIKIIISGITANIMEVAKSTRAQNDVEVCMLHRSMNDSTAQGRCKAALKIKFEMVMVHSAIAILHPVECVLNLALKGKIRQNNLLQFRPAINRLLEIDKTQTM